MHQCLAKKNSIDIKERSHTARRNNLTLHGFSHGWEYSCEPMKSLRAPGNGRAQRNKRSLTTNLYRMMTGSIQITHSMMTRQSRTLTDWLDQSKRCSRRSWRKRKWDVHRPRKGKKNSPTNSRCSLLIQTLAWCCLKSTMRSKRTRYLNNRSCERLSTRKQSRMAQIQISKLHRNRRRRSLSSASRRRESWSSLRKRRKNQTSVHRSELEVLWKRNALMQIQSLLSLREQK